MVPQPERGGSAEGDNGFGKDAKGNFSNLKAIGDGVSEYRRNGNQRTSPPPRKSSQNINYERNKGQVEMALTKDFRETVRDRAQNDPAFRRALLQEAIDLFLSGDVETGQSVLRDYINATVGFQELARIVHTPAPSLMRMFSSAGNPSAKNVFSVIAELQKQEGVKFRAQDSKRSS
jgi:DNA-binding phage protein